MANSEAISWQPNYPVNGSVIFSLQQQGANGSAVAQELSDLIFDASHSVRAGTIILASLNIIAAIAIGISILYDCYWASKRGDRGINAM